MEEKILKEDLSKNKRLTPELKIKIRKIYAKHFLVIGLIFVYTGIITLAFYKMELNTLATDLKVLSLGFLCFAIIKFEQGYKKDNEGIFLIGVEALVLALMTLFMTSFISIEENEFKNITTGFCVFALIYYLLKNFIMINKIKKEHKKQISDVRDIIHKKGDI